MNVLLTLSGPDHPGITSDITGQLAGAGATLVDATQAVIHGVLSLSLIFQWDPAKDLDAFLAPFRARVAPRGLTVETRILGATSEQNRAQPPATPTEVYAITLIANPITAAALHKVTSVLAKRCINIDRIRRLSEPDFASLELIVSTPPEAPGGVNPDDLKRDLVKVTRSLGIDIAVQREGLYRRSKRLVVFDMDSTLIQNEVIDELAREAGVYAEVSAITHRAMAGELSYDESLKLRCAMLKGLSSDALEKVYSRITLTPGAQDLVTLLKRLGYKTAVISGGFTFVVDRLKAQLGIDFGYANVLQLKDGFVTGTVAPPIVNAQRKADLLEVIAQQEHIVLDQVIAIGDGANDLLMLERAGLGIAFNAKPKVSAQADVAVSQPNLCAILYLLGFSTRDLTEALALTP